MGNKKRDPKIGYVNETRCNVCKAKDTKGNLIRDQVDARILNGETHVSVVDWLRSEGNNIYPAQLSRHILKHAPYVNKAKYAERGISRIVRMKAEIKKADADTALQRIIDIGNDMVETGKMPVTERLYIEAIKEQGKRGNKTMLDVMMIDMDREVIEGETVEEEQSA